MSYCTALCSFTIACVADKLHHILQTQRSDVPQCLLASNITASWVAVCNFKQDSVVQLVNLVSGQLERPDISVNQLNGMDNSSNQDDANSSSQLSFNHAVLC